MSTKRTYKFEITVYMADDKVARFERLVQTMGRFVMNAAKMHSFKPPEALLLREDLFHVNEVSLTGEDE